ncbi:hypothetical protein MRB53_016209 [Persea americana]|uniref:Uncharacterized protein n=1 Tax=Persea americana TaxID=3435 RepID=A0ACC2M1J8_PERAE|nr:hypothetical protein MRB53_016209 [Persea americana]
MRSRSCPPSDFDRTCLGESKPDLLFKASSSSLPNSKLAHRAARPTREGDDQVAHPIAEPQCPSERSPRELTPSPSPPAESPPPPSAIRHLPRKNANTINSVEGANVPPPPYQKPQRRSQYSKSSSPHPRSRPLGPKK